MKRCGWVFLFLILVSPVLQGAESFTVEDIRVQGLQRISAGTVFNYLPVRVGEQFDMDRSGEAIRALFQTGFFEDVRLLRDDDVLVVEVRERPAVASIEITGNREISTDDLMEGLEQVGLVEGRVFNRALFDRVEQELRRQYFARGRYGASIDTTVTELERNRVAIEIDITEDRIARIQEINIVGNEAFEDGTLLGEFDLREAGPFTFWGRRDQYSRQRLSGDLEQLRSYYLDRGYINFDIESTQVSISPDRRSIYITINVDEGDQYKVRGVRLAGDLIVDEEDLNELISVETGDIFSRREVTESASRITDRLGAEGYAFANVNPIPDVDEETREVDIRFMVDPGKRVYVRRVNIYGNARTRDEVLRREMRQMEGGWFSTEKVERSRTRLNRLGYFDDVNVETPMVPGTDDQVDVNFTVTERPSGSIMVGAGFSQEEGVLVNASVSQQNFLGTGNRLSVDFNNSRVREIYSVTYTNPYYTIDGISRSFSAFYRSTDAARANLANYVTDVFGGNVRFGIPMTEYDTFRIGAGFEDTNVKTTDRTPVEIEAFIDEQGDTFQTYQLQLAWLRDSRDRAIFPTRGFEHTLSTDISIPGSDVTYHRTQYRATQYFPLTDRLTLSLGTDLGWGDGYGSTDDMPFFDHFFAGGPRTVRGFRANTLGPRAENDDPLGGTLRTVARAQLSFPPPFAEDVPAVRFQWFVDAGNVFATPSDFDSSEIRYSTGLGMTWMSPLGPLTFSYAEPLNDEPEDRIQNFQFSIGLEF